MMSEQVDAYVSVMHKYYNFSPDLAPWEFQINTNAEMLKVLDLLFRQMQGWEASGMWRAHLPAVPYHLDAQNNEVDKRLAKVYAIIHEYGDEETKKFIEGMPYYS
ncbi:transposase [Rummeliibacillus sp. TYF-LIM-RU47]|nr:transposase [Rummeliibacillus sp. TYF-LIM-RU47]